MTRTGRFLVGQRVVLVVSHATLLIHSLPVLPQPVYSIRQAVRLSPVKTGIKKLPRDVTMEIQRRGMGVVHFVPQKMLTGSYS